MESGLQGGAAPALARTPRSARRVAPAPCNSDRTSPPRRRRRPHARAAPAPRLPSLAGPGVKRTRRPRRGGGRIAAVCVTHSGGCGAASASPFYNLSATKPTRTWARSDTTEGPARRAQAAPRPPDPHATRCPGPCARGPWRPAARAPHAEACILGPARASPLLTAPPLHSCGPFDPTTLRFVLAVGSAVFDAMFNGGMATTSTEIELPDVEPAAFLALLKVSGHRGPGPTAGPAWWLSHGWLPATPRKAWRSGPCRSRLRVGDLPRAGCRCSPNPPLDVSRQARLFDEPQLASLCLENIDKNTADAITAEGFTDIDLDTLVAVLERDTLGIREVRLFNAVVRWSEAECQRQQLQVTPENRRKVLGKALGLIRFPLMTIEEFAAGPAQSGILVDREVVSLFLHFTVNPKPRVEFIDRPRCCLRGKECSINRFQQVESRWGYSGTSDRIRFSVNKRIFVVGFGLYGSIHGPTDYQVNIQIIHTDSNTVLGQNDTGFSCDGSASTFRVMFKEPVEVLPNVNYTACATLKGPDSHYGTKGLRKVTHESPTTGAKTCFTFCYAAGNNNGTSVEDGQIPEVIFYT
nr:BTB/POZ domain-containing protein 2 [Aotus nancymaae]